MYKSQLKTQEISKRQGSMTSSKVHKIPVTESKDTEMAEILDTELKNILFKRPVTSKGIQKNNLLT
jgi:hypothetical protein